MKNKQRKLTCAAELRAEDCSHKSYNATLGEAEGKCKHSAMETIIINTKLIGALPPCAHWHSSSMKGGRVAF